MSSTNTNNAGQTAGDSVKGVFAAIHGVGEQIRGTVNSGVDSAFNGRGGNEEGIAKNNAINEQGRNEVETGIFSANTVNKETTKEGHGI